MESTRFAAWLFVASTVWFTARSEAWEFYVGGKDGWVQNPSESYNHWAERNRFRVNDTLFFRYEKGKDSVLVVTKDDYDSCDTSSPLLALTDGASRFKFDRSGPFFFISGIADRCNAGQKLIVVVLAVRNTPGGGGGPTPSPAPPAAQPPVPPPPQPDSPGGTSPSDGGAPAPAPSRSSASKAGFPCGGGVGLVIALGVGLLIGG